MEKTSAFRQYSNALRGWVASILVAGVAWLMVVLTALGAGAQSWDGRAWHIARHSDDARLTLTHWLLPGQTTAHWTELVALQLFSSQQSPDQVLADLRENLERSCPKVVWTTRQKDLQSILYEWQVKDCVSRPDQHEIAKLVRSDEGVYRVSYSTRGLTLNPDDKDRWIQLLDSFQPSALKRLRREAAIEASAGVSAKLDAERNSPGVVFELEEVSRRREEDATAVRYRFKVAGLPADKDYVVWNVPGRSDKPIAMLRAEVDAKGEIIYDFEGERGRLNELLVKIRGYVKAQAAKFALVSTDGSVHSIVKKIPFPITHQDGTCQLSVEMLTPDTYNVLLSGFTDGEVVDVTANLGKKSLKEKFAAPARTQRDGVQRRIQLHFQRPSGLGMVKAVAESCTVSAQYEWGTQAKVQ
ncbi:MAG: hypothetical protein R3268_07115 [Acidiferrobacterales bacterium]|nr:hypothetical protein [Acidiferrobacterales bacterium]